MDKFAKERVIQFDVSPTFARVLNRTVQCSEKHGGCGKDMTIAQLAESKGKRLCGDCRYRTRRIKIENKTLEQHVASSVSAANRRSRVRGCTDDQLLSVEEALEKWTGKCSSCEKELSWTPGTKYEPNYDLASIDRIITTDEEKIIKFSSDDESSMGPQPKRYNLRKRNPKRNSSSADIIGKSKRRSKEYIIRGYKNNMTWLCARCNTDKGARDYVEQLAQRIHVLENMIIEKDRIIAKLQKLK